MRELKSIVASHINLWGIRRMAHAESSEQQRKPDCAAETIWPCCSENWQPCSECRRLICEIHDYLLPVWFSGEADHRN
jgi:hypothetical protein